RRRDRARDRRHGRRPASPEGGRPHEGRGQERGRAPMRHGLRIPSFALGPRTATLEEMGRYLRRAEDLGFDCAVSIDHLLLTPPAYACTWLEPIALLGALAGVTRTLRLGTMVLVLPLRNPVSFAKEWATLDLLSRGRSILGIGVGWHAEEFALMGVPYRERGARELGRDPTKIGRVYSNFIWVLRPGEPPESAIPHFSVFSGMDLEYWTTHYLLGEAKELAERISARVEALDGGVDTIVLNPLNWGMEQLELIAGEVLPRVRGRQ